MCLTVSSVSVGGIRQLIVHIHRIDETLMGYWIVVQVCTMTMIIMCKINLIMGDNILRRVLMMPCSVLLRSHLRSASSITLLCSVRIRVDGFGEEI